MLSSFQRALLLSAGLAATLLLPLSDARAVSPPDHLHGHEGLELYRPDAPIRQQRALSWQATGTTAKALAAVEAELGPVWSRVDRDTGVLDTLVPRALLVPGSIAEPGVAASFARDFLARHLEALAPGADPGDFVLVTDLRSGDRRDLGFVQHAGGLPVIGGQLSFRFKADRLTAVRSQALPRVQLAPRSAAVDLAAASTSARRWVADDFAAGQLVDARELAGDRQLKIFPLVHSGGVIDYREVVELEVAVDQPPGQWRVWVDARTGEPVARISTLLWAELNIEGWVRSPQGPRATFPAQHLQAEVGGELLISDETGLLAPLGPNTPTLLTLDSPFLEVVNAAGPTLTTNELLSPGVPFLWTSALSSEEDAQLNAYVHTQLVKDYVRAIDPSFDVPDLDTEVTVNISDTCNAFANGNTINFFLAGGGCENTALLSDVVYHEFGHVVHVLGLIPGVGQFDGALSEGIADYLSATIVGDPSVGRGFFFDDQPLRELDPEGFEWRWPEDRGPVHSEGRIIGGTLWDLRTLLIDKYGEVEGIAITDEIWLQSIRRAVDIPSMYLEALIANDNDGDLQNGTPDVCEINAAFAAHGLYDPPGLAGAVLDTTRLEDGSLEVSLDVDVSNFGCADSGPPTAVLRWRPRAESGDLPWPTNEEVMVASGTRLSAAIPRQANYTVVEYQVELDWNNGTSRSQPDNVGDPWYQYFFGEAELIWCSDFASDPFAEGWSGDPLWQWGVPSGASGEPDSGHSGDSVLGTVLDWPGQYPPGVASRVDAPTVDVRGYDRVRLQYRRWLTVEDGFYDQAEIWANGEQAWENFTSTNSFEGANTHHRDSEWRFHDVELTDFIGPEGTVDLAFILQSDGGLEFGGWNLDELCIVGHSAVAEATCGDGWVDEGEACDDANLEDGDGCSSSCELEDDPGAEIDWVPDGRGCGCSTEPDADPRGGLALGLLGFLSLLGLHGLGLRRRRRFAHRS